MSKHLVGRGVVLGFLLLGLVCSLYAREEGKVDLNTASAQQLQSLPGIGPAMADRIVEYREEHGPFRRIEDLMNVRGIGEKRFLQLKDLITVGRPSASEEASPPGR